MHRPTPQQPELLAPCGSLEAFFAAMENGADAVYCGLKDFSARAKARNIALPELERMLGYARAHDKRVYVTLNTLIKERELPQLAETLADLEALKVDGIIIQDPAIWRLARQSFPGLELHASTQLTIHNSAGVRMLERLGFTRGVLARELTLDEITAIRRDTSLELEHFVHGALCFCFSGQCYFSSWLGGKSGNRGRCAQPCRRRYRHGQKDGYWFSPNDLSAIDLLPELSNAGVCSFKIEGRMKSAEYVAAVVGAYRSVLAAPQQARSAAVQAAKERLRDSFGRPPTKGFLSGPVPADIVAPATAGATGRFLGTIDANRDAAITFKCRDKLHLGDRLRVQPKSDQAGQSFTVKELFSNRRTVKQVSAGSVVSVPHTFGALFRVGDAVYKVSSEQAFTLSEAACRRRLEPFSGGVPTGFSLAVAIEGDTLTLKAQIGDNLLQRSYPVELFPAEQRGLDHATLHKVFNAGADTNLRLEALTHGDLPTVVVPPSRLKEIRREFYRELAAVARNAQLQQRRQHLQSALATLLPARSPVTPRKRHVTVAIQDARDAHILSDEQVDRLILPLTMANLRDPGILRRLAGREQQVVWDIPFILIGKDWERTQQAVSTLYERGFRGFRLNNLGHFPLFDHLTGLRLSTGSRLFSLNSQARLAWRELEIGETTLYVEDDRGNLSELLGRETGLDALLTVYASIPLLTSRIPLKELRADTPILSDRSEPYRVQHRDGLFTLRPDVDFSLLGQLDEIMRLGVDRILIDLGHLGPFSPQGKKVLDAARRGIALPGTSVFNFQQGME